MNSATLHAPGAAAAPTAPVPATPWWRVRMLWLVIGGPLAVVAASFVTLALALMHPDPVIQAEGATTQAEQPAVQARNHAASPRR